MGLIMPDLALYDQYYTLWPYRWIVSMLRTIQNSNHCALTLALPRAKAKLMTSSQALLADRTVTC